MENNTPKASTKPNLKALVKSMIDAKKTVVADEPVWVARHTFATLKREEGTLINDGRGIIYRGLQGDLAPLNGVILKLKGKGPLVKVTEAVAVRNWSNEYNGKTYSIKKGDVELRCFS